VAAERRSAVWFALVLAVIALPTPAAACRCVPLPLTDYAARADLVAQVRVQSVEIADDGRRRAAVQVLDDVRNAAGLRTVTTAADGAQCGVDLQRGARYWIFGRLAPGTTDAVIGLCDGSRAVAQDFTDTPAAQVAGVLLAWASEGSCPGPAPAEIAARIILEGSADAPSGGGGTLSPNGAYRFVLDRSTPVQRHPRIARLRVDRERDAPLQLSLQDVAGEVAAQWVNEKLVLVQVHWSRTLRSDLLVDVEAARLLAVDSAELDDRGRVLRWLDRNCALPAQ
jgi:hypothetical protein